MLRSTPFHSRAILSLAMLAMPAAFAAESYLNGGKITPIETSVVETSPDHLNFCFATRYPDGSIHLNHSVGIHTVTERGCSDISTDDGKTWKRAEGGACGINSFLNSEGKKVQLSCWALKPAKKHKLGLKVYDDATGKFTTSSCEVELPWSSQFLTHRDVIRTSDNRLLATAYGRKEGAKKCHSFMIESTDDGKTWHYLSTIADDPEGKTVEGPDETTIFELKNGNIVAAYRDNGMGPMKQVISKDGGKTWSEPVEIAPFAASPHGRVLENGTVVIVSGRPNLYMLVDFTGEAKDYQQVMLYRGSGSSYASVLEVAPNEVVVIHDESDFGSWRSATPFSRIFASRYKVEKDDSLSMTKADPRAKDYTIFYSPAIRKLPQELRLAIPAGYQQKSPEAITYCEIVEIPERPHPVLRIISRGNNDKVSGSEWSLFRSATLPDGVRKLQIGFEFRLGDADVTKPQFMVSGVVGATADVSGKFGYATFAVDGVHYLDGSSRKVFPCDITTGKFNAFRMDLDADTDSWTLTRIGDDKPLFTAKLTPNAQAPTVNWGDGSKDVFGSVDLSYIGWKY